MPLKFFYHPDWELVFADDERDANPTTFKFLQMAHAWKSSQGRKPGGSGILSGFTAATTTSTTKTHTMDDGNDESSSGDEE